MQTVFATHSEDHLGLAALTTLKELGCKTKTLDKGEIAPPDAVVFFTPPITHERWSSSHLLTAAHRLMEIRPRWAGESVFLVAMRPNTHGSLKDAVVQIARGYEHWLLSAFRCLPWGNEPEANRAAFDEWLSRAADIRGNRKWSLTEGLWVMPPKKKRVRTRKNLQERVVNYAYAVA